MGFDCVPDRHPFGNTWEAIAQKLCVVIRFHCVLTIPSRMRMSQQQEQYSDNVVPSHVTAGDLDAAGDKSECP